MATNRIIVGKEDCKILKVTSLLKSSQSFHLFHDNWTLIANDLETRRDLVKTLHRSYLLSTIGLIDIVNSLVEEWVGRKSEDATLQELVRILEDNGLKDCSDSVVNGIIGEKQRMIVKKYIRLPVGFPEFVNGSSKLCILQTPDISITCDKLSENVENHSLHDNLPKFLDIMASPAKRDVGIVDIVRDYKMKNLQQLQNLWDGNNVDNKVVLVTLEEEAVIKGALVKLTSSRNIPELLHDTMHWGDLTLSFQIKLTNTLEQRYKIDFEDLEVNGQLLVDLIHGKDLLLFRQTLPEELSYYVERAVSTRKCISIKIFEQNSGDIFAFTGISMYELSNLAKSKLTDTSNNQLRQPTITVNFIILNQINHFEKIAEKSHNSVHLIHYANGKLKWIKSKGNLLTLQNYLDHYQDELHEEDLIIKKLNSESNQAVIISDSPGMGKSVLLGKIGKRLERKDPKRTVVFIILTEFIRNFHEADNLTETTRSVLESTLCEHDVGKTVLRHKLTSEEISLELLLDGFDELDSAHLNLAYKVLQAIYSIKSIRLWVTSRPHLLEELENHLNVFGYNINPFEEKHQIEFLSSYWSRNGQLNRHKLESFSVECLENLKMQMDSRDHDVAGIPLQCLLLGQVFEDEAIASANSEELLHRPVLITKITDLYNVLIVKKFAKYFTTHANVGINGTISLMEMHVRLSLELMFPEYVEKLKEQLSHVKLEELLKVGFLESSSTEGSPRFLHRTFAEYFLACFIVDKLGSKNGWNGTMADFLFERVLDCKIEQERFVSLLGDNLGIAKSDSQKIIFGFSYPVITYFMNSLINEIKEVSVETSHSINEKCANAAKTGLRIVCAFARQNLANNFTFFDGTKAFETHSRKIFNKKCLMICIDYAEMQLMKRVLEHFERRHGWERNIYIQAEVLHRAIARGKFCMVEFFIKEKGLREILQNWKGLQQMVKSFKGLVSLDGFLHICVKNTRNQSASDIEERVHILRLLVGINQKLLEEINSEQKTPLLQIK